LTGQEPNAELMDKIKKMGEVLQFNSKITEFFAAEYKFNTLVSDLYKIIGDACDVGANMFDE
ncbi:MAG: YlbF family regulator, partial [Christensenella sp.]